MFFFKPYQILNAKNAYINLRKILRINAVDNCFLEIKVIGAKEIELLPKCRIDLNNHVHSTSLLNRIRLILSEEESLEGCIIQTKIFDDDGDTTVPTLSEVFQIKYKK